MVGTFQEIMKVMHFVLINNQIKMVTSIEINDRRTLKIKQNIGSEMYPCISTHFKHVLIGPVESLRGKLKNSSRKQTTPSQNTSGMLWCCWTSHPSIRIPPEVLSSTDPILLVRTPMTGSLKAGIRLAALTMDLKFIPSRRI